MIYLEITPVLDKLLEYKRNWIQHVKRMPRDRLQNKFTHCKGIRDNTGSRQTAGIQEELVTACKQNASRQTAQGNETLFPNWQKESWQTSEETGTGQQVA